MASTWQGSDTFIEFRAIIKLSNIKLFLIKDEGIIAFIKTMQHNFNIQSEIFNVFESLISPRLHYLIKISENSNIVKYHYNLKWLFLM